jgi:acetylornithine deacetylase/succinyl-diaminopimelate desuccinylase-like protein
MPTKISAGNRSIYERPVELLQNLIRIDTTNPPGNESECIIYINELLKEAGFDTTFFAKDKNRPNLIARLKGQGKTPPLMLYGHVDVVPTANQAWTYPPFEAKIVDGYIWGRGALDMKGGIAMMLAAVLRAKAEGLTPSGDIVLLILCDEEAGSESICHRRIWWLYRACRDEKVLSYSNCGKASLLDKSHYTRARWARRPFHSRWCNGKIVKFAISAG